jgi:hypothetical protein
VLDTMDEKIDLHWFVFEGEETLVCDFSKMVILSRIGVHREKTSV